MGKERLEAFSDGVFAIIITIMVLELRPPAGAAFRDLQAAAPAFLSYVLSFVYAGIYWNNHHHLWRTVSGVSGPVMWANMHLLFWLSMVPFATDWMGAHPQSPAPVALYGVVLIMNGIAYTILSRLLVRGEGPGSALAGALGHRLWQDTKGNLSVLLYAAAIAAAFAAPAVAQAIYALVAAIWIIPDRRLARAAAGEAS